jgi:uncharacterized protein (TIGR00730 family)
MTENNQQAVCKSICVYCGASNQVSDIYKDVALQLGTAIGQSGRRLVYGGGKVGLMGLAADAALKAGGEVIGIIPSHIRDREIQHMGLTELHVVETMHVRKKMMVDRADAFVVLPGGIGTLDELCEILTWKQLGIHDMPIVILNVNCYWDTFLTMIDHIISQGFMRPEHKNMFHVVNKVEDVLPKLCSLPPEHFDPATKWI